jgi:hypothetical protein
MTIVLTDTEGHEITHFYKKVRGKNHYNFFCSLHEKWYSGNKEHLCPYCNVVTERKFVKPYWWILRGVEDRAITEHLQSEVKQQENDTGKKDPFKKPVHTRLVTCLHCGDTYQSDEMVFEQRFKGWFKLWYCKNKDCSGAGYGFDIHDFNQEKHVKIKPIKGE